MEHLRRSLFVLGGVRTPSDPPWLRPWSLCFNKNGVPPLPPVTAHAPTYHLSLRMHQPFISACCCAWIVDSQYGPSDQPEAYFNGSSYIRLQTTISLKRQTGFSFRTCAGGELFSQQLNDHAIEIAVLPDRLTFVAKTSTKHFEEHIAGDYVNNKWHSVSLTYRQGNLTLSVDDRHLLLANATFHPELLTSPGLYNEGAVLIVGKHYNGCILEGPSITFNRSVVQPHNVLFGRCPIQDDSCRVVRPQDVKAAQKGRNYCEIEPCMMHGECVNEEKTYTCICTARYSGKNCELDNGPPCTKAPCKNGATCTDDISGDYRCSCASGYTGKNCETEVKTHPLCIPNPCLNAGQCQITNDENKVECVCAPGYAGLKCEKNVNECQSNPCRNGGACVDEQNGFSCDCSRTGYAGPNCDVNVNECLSKPCANRGVCYDTYGSYMCECQPGYDGVNCEKKINECKSHPCQNHGKCEEKPGGFECHCPPGYGGQHCELELRKGACDSTACGPYADCKEIGGVPTCTCKPEFIGHYPNCISLACYNNPCLNGGVCTPWMGTYNCTCPPGYRGIACERLDRDELCDEETCENGGTCFHDERTSFCLCEEGWAGGRCERRANCTDDPCINAVYCKDYHGGYYCKCESGWTGTNCDVNVNECAYAPCLNGATCVDLLNDFKCQCVDGFYGERCQNSVGDCKNTACLNGGTCVDTPKGAHCNCTEQWFGPTCERQIGNACELKPCQHNGTCVLAKNMRDYTCKCVNGFEGKNCETNVNDCLGVTCPPERVCVDLVGAYECQCPPGYAGDACQSNIDPCLVNPCQNNGKCTRDGHNYTCKCPPGYEGSKCESDIDECRVLGDEICKHGICVNKEGTFQCYCMPGYTGERCNLDFDECLSQPCLNNATCLNKVNNYECVCPPGYKGKNCDTNIDECESNPCQDGSTCVDGINEFRCVCQAGLTGKRCEVNIDDCESSPCLNGASCIDGLNMYRCDCADTGYRGVHCEINIDDCASNPCQNGALCVDEVKNYRCECFKGYAGKNCEQDVDECTPNPCQYLGVCLQKSNRTLYDPAVESKLPFALPMSFKKKFDYHEAAGYECICVPGVVGENCDVNVNECESQPCMAGTCSDRVGGYLCECDDGFEGDQCEIDIDECEKYHPCVNGSCIDKRASYFCDCDSGYGGKNCSVELTGCRENPCRNGGTCKPYLDNEVQHKFNCTCSHGFHGHTCERITTMSLSGQSMVTVNTTRDEGHDIQFRFKTTLGDGFLALGRGSTYYILSLAKGRLNLHSSLLNKWDGVFVGSNLNDSNWQRVFVAINSSHLVLSANDEQTIYPINYNDNNGSSTNFPTTYVGGYPDNHRILTHEQPFLVGCVEDLIVNGEWVLPESQNSSWVGFQDVVGGCHREEQCTPNPCHSGGYCTDLWSNFSCTCERPYLGYTCQYNYTAATFCNENITDSLVTVTVNDVARRAVRAIVDISMFIRTRQSRGQIFYLGSAPGSPNLHNESYIVAQLEGGELLVRIQFNGTFESYTVGGVKLNDGYNHLIEVIRNVTLVQVKLNGTEYFRKTISATGTLDAQVLFLGGQPQLRPIRQTTSEISVAKTDVTPATGPAAIATPLSMIHFKGIIQDVQISDGSKIMVVEFFPLQAQELSIPMSFGVVSFDNATVLEGVISDDSCRSTPCHHHGVCQVTWNDYVCQCPRGFKGKDCLELVFCDLESCPEGSRCKNLDYIHECVANATFDGETPPLRYNLTLTTDPNRPFLADDIELIYRTRSWGTLLFAVADADYFAVFVHHNEVVVEWRIGDDDVVARRFLNRDFDGRWATLTFKYKDRTFKGGFKENVGEDGADFVVNDFNVETFSEIFAKGTIYVAGSDNRTFDYWKYLRSGGYNASAYVTLVDTTTVDPTISNSIDTMDINRPLYKVDLSRNSDQFKGCLGELHVGKLLLPYFRFDQIYSKQKPDEYFQLLPAHNHSIGCRLCYEKDCYNGGSCVDPGGTYKCDCPVGYTADDCSIDIDECVGNKCENNATCTDLVGKYQCNCALGYEGVLCEKEINECESNPCHNGGKCVDLLGNFRCECPEDYVGKQCEALRLITCDNLPCKDGATCENGKNELTQNNFTCICAEGMRGTICDTPYCFLKNETCQNGGHCNVTSPPSCACAAGYEGAHCEHDIDECASGPCLNGGVCTDGVAAYSCNCAGVGFTGDDCEIDVDECANATNPCVGECVNTPGSYRCLCPNRKCGYLCNFEDPCDSKPCQYGDCVSNCTDRPDYYCECEQGWGGKNCAESAMREARNDGFNILYVVIPTIIVILLGLVTGLVVLVNVARSKRATRGTYSPSAQEFCNPRVELDHVLKPPPEERLI